MSTTCCAYLVNGSLVFHSKLSNGRPVSLSKITGPVSAVQTIASETLGHNIFLVFSDSLFFWLWQNNKAVCWNVYCLSLFDTNHYALYIINAL